MNKNLVTIGFTTYNSQDTIIGALTSALNQDYENIELLIVDDNSTDLTLKKINKELTKRNYKYRIIKHNMNMGVAAARNTLLKNAKGQFIAFFDSDDISHRDRISKQIKKIINFEKLSIQKNRNFSISPLCYSDRKIIFDKSKELLCKAMFIHEKDYKFKQEIIGALLFCNTFPKKSNQGSTATCTLCARVETLKLLNGFNSKLRRYEDLDIVIKAIQKNVPLCTINECLIDQFYYRREYKKNNDIYAIELIEQHKKWLIENQLFYYANNFILFKNNILSFKFFKAFYFLYLLLDEKPILTMKKIISSMNTLCFSIKFKLITIFF